MLPRMEMSRDECRKYLRYLELDAYANMVSVLRAQGPLTVDKKKLLQEIASVLHITNERHRAEIRRAVNDDKLSAVAEQLNGPNTGTDWAIEGRRTIPLLPRLKAHNAFTTLANSLSVVTAIANEKDVCIVKKPLDVKEVLPNTKTPVVNIDVPESRKRKHSTTDVLDNGCNSPKIIKSQKLGVSNAESSALLVPMPNKILLSPSASDMEVAKQSKNVTIIPVTASNASTSTVSPVQNLLPQTLVCNNTNIQIQRSSANSTVPISLSSTVKREHKLMTIRTKPAQNSPSNNGIETEVKDVNINADKAIKLVSISNNIQKISKSDLNSNTHCIKTLPVTDSVTPTTDKSIPQSNALQTITTNSSCFTSCGPGPPSNETAKLTTNFISNKFPSFKINKFTTAKMTGTKLTTKGNFIVLQKAPLREITLSRGGKEVLGKLIMGGKNVRLTNQQNTNAITLVPHRTTQITHCNGEQSATNSAAATTIHTKTNNVTLISCRDSPETNKTAIQFDHGPTNFDVKFQAALVDQTEEDLLLQDKSNDSTNSISSIENNSQDEASLHEKDCDEADNDFRSSELKYENNICNDENECSTAIVDGILDPQTGIYNIQSAAENANSMEIEDFSAAKIFESDFGPTKLNVESYTLMESEETGTILDVTESAMLIIDEIDELCNS